MKPQTAGLISIRVKRKLHLFFRADTLFDDINIPLLSIIMTSIYTSIIRTNKGFYSSLAFIPICKTDLQHEINATYCIRGYGMETCTSAIK